MIKNIIHGYKKYKILKKTLEDNDGRFHHKTHELYTFGLI